MKKPTKEEIADLVHTIDAEGLGYYMTNYAHQDLDLLEQLGFDKKRIKDAISLLEEIEVLVAEYL